MSKVLLNAVGIGLLGGAVVTQGILLFSILFEGKFLAIEQSTPILLIEIILYFFTIAYFLYSGKKLLDHRIIKKKS